MPRKTADREIAAQAAPKRRRVAGEEKKAHSWHPFQFYREAEEAKEPESDYRPDAIIRHRKAKERFEKREREAKERAAAEKKKAKAAEAAARETVDADELRRLEMEQREAKQVIVDQRGFAHLIRDYSIVTHARASRGSSGVSYLFDSS